MVGASAKRGDFIFLEDQIFVPSPEETKFL